MAAFDAILKIILDCKVHATGYCLAAKLLSVVAAAIARAADDRLTTLTLLAAQTDFSEPGELALFIDPSEMHYLRSMIVKTRAFYKIERFDPYNVFFLKDAAL